MAGMAQVQLARLYEARGDLAAAAAAYEAFLRRPTTLAPFKLHAYVHLFRLKQALGDPISASVNLQTAKSLALQSNDAELQLNLAAWLFRRGDKDTARQMLEAGIRNAEMILRSERDAHKRLWWEYLIARRLDLFWDYAGLAERVGRVNPDLLENNALDETTRYGLYCYLIRAMEASGRGAEAEALCEKAIQSIPEDSERLGHVLYRLSQQAKKRGDAVRVRELAAETFREVPTSRLAQLMYLRVAVEDFNAGKTADALAKTSQLEAALAVTPERGHAEHIRWGCQYVKGRCLKAAGNVTEGQRLAAEALGRQPRVAELYGLNEPPTSPR